VTAKVEVDTGRAKTLGQKAVAVSPLAKMPKLLAGWLLAANGFALIASVTVSYPFRHADCQRWPAEYERLDSFSGNLAVVKPVEDRQCRAKSCTF